MRVFVFEFFDLFCSRLSFIHFSCFVSFHNTTQHNTSRIYALLVPFYVPALIPVPRLLLSSGPVSVRLSLSSSIHPSISVCFI